MTDKEKARIKEVVEIIGGDGHTVYDGAILDGLPATVTKGLLHKQGGGSDPKSKVFANGKEVTPLAVHGLSLLFRIAGYIGADTKEANKYMGRGRQAGALHEAITAKLA